MMRRMSHLLRLGVRISLIKCQMSKDLAIYPQTLAWENDNQEKNSIHRLAIGDEIVPIVSLISKSMEKCKKSKSET